VSEVPRYVCHKTVRALQIDRVEGFVLHFTDQAHEAVTVVPGTFARYTPVPGDYYVLYDNDYASVSPKAVFEAGYTRVSS